MLISNAQSQRSNNINENIKKSLSIGSAKELSKNFDSFIDLDLGIRKGTFSASQAEFMLKDFFKIHAATSFQYIHQGGSNSGGQRYAIGKYNTEQGSYRVLIRIKRKDSEDRVYNLSFTKE